MASTKDIPPGTKMDDAAALRAELEIELKNKKQCTYQTYECTQLCLDGYKFCSKHILEDKTAPFKQCSYIYSSNGKRCHIPAQRMDKRDYGYCSEHALKATLARNKQNAKNPPPRTAEVLLHSLCHYVKKPHVRSISPSTPYSEDNDHLTLEDVDQKFTKFNDPFVDVDASTILNERYSEVLDFCSESDSDIEASTFSSVWHDAQADSSDNESIDSEQEDLLKHANVYTGEEVTVITRDKLSRLQALYVEQYRHLQYLLTEKRRKYLHSLKRERETCCNINNQVRDNSKEQRLYRKLKALNNYQKYHGTDGILNKKLKDLRAKITDGNLSKNSTYSKCCFTEGGVKCGERTIPLSKFCQKHILEDTNQVLYRPCGKITEDVTCKTPIAAIFDESTCHLHLEIPVLRSYSHIRKDSESDIEETINTHLHYTSQITEDIKNEFINYVPPEIPKMETLPTMLFEENSSLDNEVINERNVIFGNDHNISENRIGLEVHSQDNSVHELNFVDIPDCLSAEVEITTELDENDEKENVKISSIINSETTVVEDDINSNAPETSLNTIGETNAEEICTDTNTNSGSIEKMDMNEESTETTQKSHVDEGNITQSVINMDSSLNMRGKEMGGLDEFSDIDVNEVETYSVSENTPPEVIENEMVVDIGSDPISEIEMTDNNQEKVNSCQNTSAPSAVIQEEPIMEITTNNEAVLNQSS